MVLATEVTGSVGYAGTTLGALNEGLGKMGAVVIFVSGGGAEEKTVVGYMFSDVEGGEEGSPVTIGKSIAIGFCIVGDSESDLLEVAAALYRVGSAQKPLPRGESGQEGGEEGRASQAHRDVENGKF